MTTDEKRMLSIYHQQGLGYKKIAQLMGLSVNTVKTYCKRNDLGGKTATDNQHSIGKVCKCCGAPLHQTPGQKPRLFCFDESGGMPTQNWSSIVVIGGSSAAITVRPLASTKTAPENTAHTPATLQTVSREVNCNDIGTATGRNGLSRFTGAVHLSPKRRRDQRGGLCKN